MKFPRRLYSSFTSTLITLFTVFLLSSCGLAEDTIDSAINSALSDITEDPVTSIDPDSVVSIDPVVSAEPGVIVDPVVPVDPVVIIDPVAPADPVVIIDPVVPADPVVIVVPVVPADPVVIVDPIAPVEPVTDQVSWVAPSEREDNSPISLSEIAGYKIYYGTNQGNYINTIDIIDSTAESYIFNELTAGTYYVVLTTYDTQGRESQYSNELVMSL
jgi:hypothetical protein